MPDTFLSIMPDKVLSIMPHKFLSIIPDRFLSKMASIHNAQKLSVMSNKIISVH
jgi:hypothetical protein